jgi:hypothetical protein
MMHHIWKGLAGTACLALAACNFGSPSKGNVAAALAVPETTISDLDCTRAEGNPGYTCSFVLSTPTTGYGILQRGQSVPLTRRFVKGDGGNWRAF